MRRVLGTVVQFAAIILSLKVFAVTPTITEVVAKQRYPWNGKVDVSYTVTGDFVAEAKQKALLMSLKVTAQDKVADKTYTATKLSGDMALTVGTHKFVWDMNAEGLTFKSDNVVFNVSCEAMPATYSVIDLSAGAEASSYPVMYLAEPPDGGFNVDEYKTTKLVLRRIEAGTFIMGTDQTNESHRVTLTKPFFCGIFEMTQRQYELVTGVNPCSSTSYGKGDIYPVHYVSYSMIRGSSDGAQWPLSSAVDVSSFMGRLRMRTGLNFDLPTDAEWEYACRAGTTTKYAWGDSTEECGEYAWYYYNSKNKSHPVGTKKANIWGLYDMNGNVAEWCLDWFQYDDTLAYGTDPIGPTSGSYSTRTMRGRYWNSTVGEFSPSKRGGCYPSGGDDFNHGFRLVRTLAE